MVYLGECSINIPKNPRVFCSCWVFSKKIDQWHNLCTQRHVKSASMHSPGSFLMIELPWTFSWQVQVESATVSASCFIKRAPQRRQHCGRRQVTGPLSEHPQALPPWLLCPEDGWLLSPPITVTCLLPAWRWDISRSPRCGFCLANQVVSPGQVPHVSNLSHTWQRALLIINHQ